MRGTILLFALILTLYSCTTTQIYIRKVVEFSGENETYFPLMPEEAVFVFENPSWFGINQQ